jgi:hypothetical protein
MKSLAIAFALFLIPVIVLLVVQTVSSPTRQMGLAYARYYYGFLFLEVAFFYVLGSAALWIFARP